MYNGEIFLPEGPSTVMLIVLLGILNCFVTVFSGGMGPSMDPQKCDMYMDMPHKPDPNMNNMTSFNPGIDHPCSIQPNSGE